MNVVSDAGKRAVLNALAMRRGSRPESEALSWAGFLARKVDVHDFGSLEERLQSL